MAVRGLRVRAKDLSIAPDLSGVLKDLKREQTAVGGLARAWSGICPPEFAALTRVDSISPGGIVVIRAADASAAWMLDQWLRGGGGDTAIRSLTSRSVRRIRVVVGSLEPGAPAPARKAGAGRDPKPRPSRRKG